MLALRVQQVRIEHRSGDDTLGIGVAEPRLSWLVETEIASWRQAAYEVEIAGDAGSDPLSSGRIDSADSVLVSWPAAPLTSRERRSVRIRVWGEDGAGSEWSEPIEVEAGLLDVGDWSARFAGASDPAADDGPLPLLRREFELPGEVVRARLYVSGLGVYELELNGQRRRRPRARARLDELRAPSALRDVRRHRPAARRSERDRRGCSPTAGTAARSASRRTCATSTATASRCSPSSRSSYADGSTHAIGDRRATGGAATGPIVASGILRRARPTTRAWSGRAGRLPDSTTEGWTPVAVVERDLATLFAPQRAAGASHGAGAPGRASERRRRAGRSSTSGRTSSARVRLTRERPSRHDDHAAPRRGARRTASCAPSRCGPAEATDRYTLRGERDARPGSRASPSTASATPRSTAGPASSRPTTSTAVVCHTDMERTGWFECSDARVEPPARERRLGHAGQLRRHPHRLPPARRAPRLDRRHRRCSRPTASFLYDTAGVLASWLRRPRRRAAPTTAPCSMVVPDIWRTGQCHGIAVRGLGRRRGHRAVDALRALRRRRPARPPVRQHAGVGRPRHRARRRRPAVDDRRPVRRLARPRGAAATSSASATDAAAARHRLRTSTRSTSSRRPPSCSARPATRAATATVAREARDAFAAEYVTPNGRLASDTQTAYATAHRASTC